MLPILRTGEAIVIGRSRSGTMRVLVDLPPDFPKALTQGRRCRSAGGWTGAGEPADYKDVVARWRSKDPTSARIVPILQCIAAATKERTQAHEQTASHVLDCRVRGIRR